MDEIEIDVFKPKVIKAPPASCHHVLRGVKSIPELGGDKELLSFANARFDGSPDSKPYLGKRSPLN